MKIGQLVQAFVPEIFDYCINVDTQEFSRLQDKGYSKETFDINFPFCRPTSMISAEDCKRFWKKCYLVHGVEVRVSSQWFNPPTSKSLANFRMYLSKRGISRDDAKLMLSEKEEQPKEPDARKARGRYKSHAIGNGQNAFVRYLLGQIGEESFSRDDWYKVLQDFGNCCAYCGSEGEIVMDHIIPINRSALGEHRLGNLIPSCKNCNSEKSSQDYRDFLADSPSRIDVVQAHMGRYNYSPMSDREDIKKVVETAYDEVRQLSDRYATIIETMLAGDAE